MSKRDRLLVAGCLLAAPVLVFPEPAAGISPALPSALAVAAIAVAIAAASRDRLWQAVLIALGAAVIAGWSQSGHHLSVLSHFTNAALGILVAAVAARVCTTRSQLRLCALGWLLMAAVALVAGASATDFPAAKLFPLKLSFLRREGALDLPGLSGLVNRNVLGILAVMTVPVAAAVVWMSAGAMRVLLGALLAMALVLGLITQSLSAWAAAVAMVLAALAWVGVRRGRVGVVIAVAALCCAVTMALWRLGPPAVDAGALTYAPPPVGVVAEPLGEGAGGEAAGLRLTEQPVPGRHGLAGRVEPEPGIYTTTVLVRPAGRAAFWLRSAGNGARFDLTTGRIDDFGNHTAWVEPRPDGWIALSYVAATPGGNLPLETLLLDRFPNGAQYTGEPGRGAEMYGPWLVRAHSPLARLRAGTVLVRGSVRASLEARRTIWEAAWGLWRSAWLRGIGLDQFRYRYQAPPIGDSGVAATISNAHNVFLQTALDIGILGLAAWIAMLGLVAVRAARLLRCPHADVRRIGVAAALGVLGVHVFGLTDAIALGAKVGLLIWLAVGLTLAAAGMSGSSAPEEARA